MTLGHGAMALLPVRREGCWAFAAPIRRWLVTISGGSDRKKAAPPTGGAPALPLLLVHRLVPRDEEARGVGSVVEAGANRAAAAKLKTASELPGEPLTRNVGVCGRDKSWWRGVPDSRSAARDCGSSAVTEWQLPIFTVECAKKARKQVS